MEEDFDRQKLLEESAEKLWSRRDREKLAKVAVQIPEVCKGLNNGETLLVLTACVTSLIESSKSMDKEFLRKLACQLIKHLAKESMDVAGTA